MLISTLIPPEEPIVQLNPYLNFNGDCETAFKFYEQCLGGKITMMSTYAGTPAESHIPPEWRDKIIHARLVSDEIVLMGSDAPPNGQGGYEPPRGFSVSLGVNKPAEAERVFAALADKGTVRMPMGKTFFAERFGMVVDRFAIPWIVICEKAA
jgi:PhnB protein